MEKVFHLEINDIGNRKEEENKRNEKKVAWTAKNGSYNNFYQNNIEEQNSMIMMIGFWYVWF
jgi:hypothetical protein